jgi:hypothetical protein
MKQLNKLTIDRLTSGLRNCGDSKVILAIWHTSNREKGGGDQKIINHYRPYLKEKIREVAGYRIAQYDELSYYESQDAEKRSGYPMRVEVARLWKKELKVA